MVAEEWEEWAGVGGHFEPLAKRVRGLQGNRRIEVSWKGYLGARKLCICAAHEENSRNDGAGSAELHAYFIVSLLFRVV